MRPAGSCARGGTAGPRLAVEVSIEQQKVAVERVTGGKVEWAAGHEACDDVHVDQAYGGLTRGSHLPCQLDRVQKRIIC